jgi:uroporphyrinogen decarboxylase
MDSAGISGFPFPFGLTFVPIETLGPVIGASRAPAADLAEACATLGASFAFVAAEAPWAAEAVGALAEASVAPLVAFSGPLWPVIRARGITSGLRATLLQPEQIGVELDDGIEALIEGVARAAEWGARAVVLAEDLAGTGGPLVAPDFAIAELVPRYGRVVAAARAEGLPAVFHSDGDIRALLPAIARAGFVAVHAGGGLDFAGFERLFDAARASGLAVMGGLLTAELSSPVSAEVIGSMLGVLAHGGGLFVADDGGITTPREVANLVTALAAARDL